MAKIELSRDEVEREDLPAVCMRCGAPASVQNHKTLGSRGKRIRVPLFFCDRHKNYSIWYSVIAGGSFILLCIFLATVDFVLALIPSRTWLFSSEFLLVMLVADVTIYFIFVDLTKIHAKQITKNSITLAGVSEEFVEHVLVSRQRKRLEQETDAF